MEKIRENEKSENGYGYSYDNNEEESLIDIRKLWFTFLRYKYWFLLSVLLCMSIAYVYLRYATPIYNVHTKVLIKDVDNSRGGGAAAALQVQDLGFMNNSSGFDNEIEVLGTKTLNKKVVMALELYTSYYNEGKVKDREIYRDYSPVWVSIDSEHLDSLNSTVAMTIEPEGAGVEVEIQYRDLELSKRIETFPAKVNTEFGEFTFIKNEKAPGEFDKTLFVFIRPLERTALGYANTLSIEPTSKTTTIAYISRTDNIPKRSSDYLN